MKLLTDKFLTTYQRTQSVLLCVRCAPLVRLPVPAGVAKLLIDVDIFGRRLDPSIEVHGRTST